MIIIILYFTRFVLNSWIYKTLKNYYISKTIRMYFIRYFIEFSILCENRTKKKEHFLVWNNVLFIVTTNCLLAQWTCLVFIGIINVTITAMRMFINTTLKKCVQAISLKLYLSRIKFPDKNHIFTNHFSEIWKVKCFMYFNYEMAQIKS